MKCIKVENAFSRCCFSVINSERKAGGFMAYALQVEKVRDVANHERLLKMLDRGIDDMEAGRELPLAEAFVKITELRNR